jgi:hypothetical protein
MLKPSLDFKAHDERVQTILAHLHEAVAAVIRLVASGDPRPSPRGGVGVSRRHCAWEP